MTMTKSGVHLRIKLFIAPTTTHPAARLRFGKGKLNRFWKLRLPRDTLDLQAVVRKQAGIIAYASLSCERYQAFSCVHAM